MIALHLTRSMSTDDATDEERIKTLEDGSKAKIHLSGAARGRGIYHRAAPPGDEVRLFRSDWSKAGNPPSRKDVEGHFHAELSK